jgi:hypothetical protein
MKKVLALTTVLVLLLGLFIVGCNGEGVAGGPAIEMIRQKSRPVNSRKDRGRNRETTETEAGSELVPGAAETETMEPAETTMSEEATATTGEATASATMAGEGGMNVVVNVSVANFEMVSAVGETDGDGYLAYYMDEFPAGITSVPGIEVSPTPEMSAGEPTNETTETSYTFENIEQGVHVFAVQLVDTSGNPLSPPDSCCGLDRSAARI